LLAKALLMCIIIEFLGGKGMSLFQTEYCNKLVLSSFCSHGKKDLMH